MKKRIIIISTIVFVLTAAVLFVPAWDTCRDGGTILYDAIMYKAIVWNIMTEEPGVYITGTDFYFLPKDFDFSKLWNEKREKHINEQN